MMRGMLRKAAMQIGKNLNGKIILQTKRCIVRELTMDDMDALYELYGPPEITRFVEPLYEREKELEYQQNYIHRIYGGYGYGMWAVIDKESDSLIGRIGVEGHLEDAVPACVKQDAAGYDHPAGNAFDVVELGYIVAVEWQRKGIAVEVCAAVLDYARDVLEMRCAYARIHPDNVASIRLAQSLGFTETDEIVDGERIWHRALQ